MRVISQKGLCRRDIPYEHSAFYVSTSGTHIYANCNGVVYSLAEYSTIEKAEKAMQKLHDNYSYLWKIEHGLVSYYADETIAFRFPQEEEI